MAITVTPDLTLISDCDAVGNWDGGAVDTDWKIQGSGCLSVQVKATTSPLYAYTFGSPVIMTNKHIYIWMMVAGRIDTKTNGGLRIYVETDANNYGYWYVAGNETYSGGWICIVIDPASSPTTGAGTVNVASVNKIGVQFKVLSTVVGQAKNCFWDVCRYGTGLTITSGVSDLIDFDDIYIEDNDSSNKYGVILKERGSYIIQGFLTFGGTEAENIDFVDKSQIILFPDNEFASTSFYGIKVQCGTGTTNFTLGEISGTAGIKGCVLKAVSSTKKFSFDVSDGDNDKIQIYGSTFLNAGTITLLSNASNREVLNCIFDGCSEILADTCIVKYCKFISSPSSAVRISSASHNITKCDFISCERGFHASTTATLSFDGLCFYNNTYDGYASAGAVTVNYNPACNPAPSSYDPAGYAITYQTSVDLIIRKVKTGNEPTDYVQCSIHKKSDNSEIMNKEANVADDQNSTYYKAIQSYNVTGIVVIVRAREKGYLPFEIELTIPSGGLDVTAVWLEDPNYV